MIKKDILHTLTYAMAATIVLPPLFFVIFNEQRLANREGIDIYATSLYLALFMAITAASYVAFRLLSRGTKKHMILWTVINSMLFIPSMLASTYVMRVFLLPSSFNSLISATILSTLLLASLYVENLTTRRTKNT